MTGTKIFIAVIFLSLSYIVFDIGRELPIAVKNEISKRTNPELWIVEYEEEDETVAVTEIVIQERTKVINTDAGTISNNIMSIKNIIEDYGYELKSFGIHDYTYSSSKEEGLVDFKFSIKIIKDDVELEFKIDPDSDTLEDFILDMDTTQNKIENLGDIL